MTGAPIRLLTYNTHLFVGTLAASLGGLFRNMEFEDRARIDDIIAKIEALDPDIVGLTEVWSRRSQRRFMEGLRELYPEQYADPYGASRMGSGLVLLSRYKLTNPSFTRYEHRSGLVEGRSDKGFILATAEVGTTRLLVALTHTQADHGDADVTARRSNLEELLATIGRSEPSDMPAVVLGDLNIVAEDASGTPTHEYRRLSERMTALRFADAFRVVNPSAASERGYTYDAEENGLVGHFDRREGENRSKQRLDYIFVRGLRPSACNVLSHFLYQSLRDGRTTHLSDHFPLYGAFTLST